MTTPMPISAADAISPAFQHAKQQLLQPFRFAQWVRLALVGILAGELGSSGGFNSHVHLPPTHHHGSAHLFGTMFPPHFMHHTALPAGLSALLFVLALGLFFLFLYISSVMRFILFDSVIAKQCHIRQGWIRRKHQGLHLFVWQIFISLASFSALFLVIGIPVAFAWSMGWLALPRQHLLPMILSGVAMFILLFVLLALLAVVHVMTKDFVVPQMALENIGALQGWQRVWQWFKAEKGNYLAYLGLKIVLAIAAGIALGIVSMLVLLLLLVPIAGVGITAAGAGMAAGWTWNLHTIALAVVFGCVVFSVFIFAFSLLSVPASVFFPAYSIYFLASRYSPLASVLWPQPPASDAPASLPTQLPPLSPA